jgi:hypothetical protein
VVFELAGRAVSVEENAEGVMLLALNGRPRHSWRVERRMYHEFRRQRQRRASSKMGDNNEQRELVVLPVLTLQLMFLPEERNSLAPERGIGHLAI